MVAPLTELLKPVCNLQVRDNWRTFARPGSFTPVGIIVHHTAGRNDLNVVINGRSDLPGPLSNLYSDRDDPFKITLISGGRCNHAGAGSQKVLNEVRLDIAPSGDAAVRGLLDGPGGNGYFYGIECENLGDGAQPWPGPQLEAVARCCAAICKHHGWSANRVIGHREWTRRKIDPRGFSMAGFRAVVARFLRNLPEVPTPTPQEDDDVAYVIWKPSGEGALLLGNGKVVFAHGSDLDKFKAAGAKDIVLEAVDYDAIPTIGNAFS